MTVLYGPDTFTGPNGRCLPTHDAGWVRHPLGHWASDCVAGGGAYGPRIYNNQLGLDYYEGTFYRDEDPPSADYAIEFDYYTTAAGSFYPALRIDESALTYYAFDVRTWSNSAILKRVAGTWTSLSGGYTQFSTSTWYHFRFEAEGTALRVYVDGSGTPLVNITDASISAAGHGGFYQEGITFPAALVDNFLLETLGAGGTTEVTSDLADSYAIRAAVSQDCADSYAIRSAITQDLADSYALRASANGDLADSYAIRGAVAQDLADAYDIQTSGVVTSDLADSYAIRAAVAQDVSDSYAIRAAVQASLADAYSVRAAVQASLADAYTIITATSADLDDGYVIRAQVAADMVDSYAVFASTGGGSCPSAAEIAAAVRTELAAELANMDAQVSGVPAAVWAHNLP